jgi:hypothetical protein
LDGWIIGSAFGLVDSGNEYVDLFLRASWVELQMQSWMTGGSRTNHSTIIAIQQSQHDSTQYFQKVFFCDKFYSY